MRSRALYLLALARPSTVGLSLSSLGPFLIWCLVDEVTTCEGHIVVYKANLDVILYVVGRPQQTELLLACALDTLYDTLTEVVKYDGRNWA